MNAWYSLLDKDADGLDGSLLVSRWNDEVMFVVRDTRDEIVAQFWIDQDQADAIRAVFADTFGSEVSE